MNYLGELVLRFLQWRKREIEAGNKWVIVGFPLVGLTLFYLFFWLLFKAGVSFALWTNYNAGFVTTVGLLLVVPFTVWAASISERRRAKRKASLAMQILLYELWHNLHHVSQIEETYRNNLPMVTASEDEPNPVLRLPHYGPRVAVIEKFIDEEHVFNMVDPYPLLVMEIYAQLATLREEFIRWREALISIRLNDLGLYQGVSLTVLTIMEPLMKNMVLVWVNLVKDIGMRSTFPQIQEAGTLVRQAIAENKRFITAYKSSWVRDNVEHIRMDEMIICWVHDWPEAEVHVLELGEIAPLYASNQMTDEND